VTHPATPASHTTPAANTPVADGSAATLAHTGADGIGLAAAASGALLLGGTVLYRRASAARR
jgi:hypothetical protein